MIALFRRWPLLLFAAFAALALFETANAFIAPRRVASDENWRAAADEVRSGFRPGDLIVFAPAWSDQVGRFYLGDRIDPAMAGRSDADRYARVWELSIRGAHAPEAQGRRVAEKSFGGVNVALWERGAPVDVSCDFTAHLSEARVTQLPRNGVGDERPCFVDQGGFHCSSTRVETRTLEVDYQPRRGILAPVDGALTTRLEFSDAEMGRQLVLYTGIHDYYARKSADGPVDLVVFVDGEKLHALRQSNAGGWLRTTVDTARFAGQKKNVRFEISAPSAAWRTFGFHAEARR